MHFYIALALVALTQALPQRAGGGTGLSLLRFGCSQSVIERLDPLVTPGLTPSPHIHQVVGGNAFNTTMPSTDISKIADCTTCSFAEDLSNYWTANMYFRAKNGSYKRVPQIPNSFKTTEVGGAMTVYYIAPGAKQTTAFKPGFRMLVGDSMARSSRKMKSQSCFRCYTGPNFQGENMLPCADPNLDFEGFPTHKCYSIRSNILFPTCWDGKTLDSPNHKDHVAYPSSSPSSFMTTGACPASHPIKIPQIVLEIIWDTNTFANEWPADGSQPLYLSTGDHTGFGQHADYVFGWKDNTLQNAMDSGCYGATCSNLKVQKFANANQCVVKNTVAESTEGWLDKLPGDGSGA